jgi:hypothetical protein
VASSCECGDEPSCSSAMELVIIIKIAHILNSKKRYLVRLRVIFNICYIFTFEEVLKTCTI